MPWKDTYTSSDEVALRDGTGFWPQGKQMGFGLTVNLNPASASCGVTAKDLAYPTWHYAMHEGLDAFLSLFASLNLRVTFAVPAVIAEAYQPQMRRILAAGHELAAAGLLGEDPNLAPDQEAERIAATTAIFTRLFGQSPKGWFALSRPDDAFASGSVTAQTAALLKGADYQYFGNGMADDAPYWWVADFAKAEAIVALPYYYHLDDTFFLMFPREGTGLERPQALRNNWHAQFKAQYRLGRFFNMTISPSRSAWAHRFDQLSDFLHEALGYPNIWAATGSEIATHFAQNFPADRHLNLSAPIWRDYPDSLS